MKPLKILIAPAMGTLVCFLFSAAVFASASPANPIDTMQSVDIFTGGYGFKINYARYNDLPGYSPEAVNFINRVDSVEILKLSKNPGGYFTVEDSVSFNAGGYQSSAGYAESFAKGGERAIFYEPAAQIRARLRSMEWSEETPENISDSHIRVTRLEDAYDEPYEETAASGSDYEITFGGFYYNDFIYSGALAAKDAAWFKAKALEAVGLPPNYKLNLLFNADYELPAPAYKNDSAEEIALTGEPDYFYYSFLDGGERQNNFYSVSANGTFVVWTEDGKTYLDAEANGRGSEGISVFMEADASIFEGIAEVMSKSRAEAWDRTLSYTEAGDVDYFSLESVYGNEITQAYVYGSPPSDYQTFRNDIYRFFADYTRNHPATVPPLESVGHIFIYAGGFSFNIYGRYSENALELDNIGVSADSGGHDANFYSDSYRDPYNYLVEKNNFYDFDFNGEAFREILDGLPDMEALSPEEFYGTDRGMETAFVSVSYSALNNGSHHSVHVILSPEEEKWITAKLAETLKLQNEKGLKELFG